MTSCNTNCSACGRPCHNQADRSLSLTEAEIEIIKLLGQYAFLPAARRADSIAPICREPELEALADSDAALQRLCDIGIIDFDYDEPLPNFGYAAYAEYPLEGSIGLTALGQRILDQLDINGIEDA